MRPGRRPGRMEGEGIIGNVLSQGGVRHAHKRVGLTQGWTYYALSGQFEAGGTTPSA